MDESKIIQILKDKEPLTGKELMQESGLDELTLWRICNKSEEIVLKIAGKRFLRLDRNVDGYARLSPSIKREFLTYTVCGLRGDSRKVDEKTELLRKNTEEISRKKYALAGQIVSKIVEACKDGGKIKKNVCFVIAGDIVFDMAHLEPRPERSTGKFVRGSDLDIVIMSEDVFPERILQQLDNRIYQAKYMYLKMPNYREEIDYIIKNISKTKKQLRFDRFESMVASKILYEGRFLYGSNKIFNKIKEMILEKKIPDKLARLEERAIVNRKNAATYLLKGTGPLPEEESIKLFYTKEETEEIF